jgi:hypothetical protein
MYRIHRLQNQIPTRRGEWNERDKEGKTKEEESGYIIERTVLDQAFGGANHQ